MAHLKLNTPQTPIDLLKAWRRRSRLNQKAHYAMVHRAEFRAFWFGVTSAVISGVVGLLILFAEKTAAPAWVSLGAGAFSIVASVITAIATSGKWSEKAAQHHAAGAAYGNVHRKLESAVAMPPSSEEAMALLIEEIRKELEGIPMSAPSIPDSVWKRLPAELTPEISDRELEAAATQRLEQ